MRWKKKAHKSPKIGDKKSKLKFLWCPLCLNNECRWLEIAKIEYKYLQFEDIEIMQAGSFFDVVPTTKNKWVPQRFLRYDPVKDCEYYLENGCVHVDGPVCHIDDCNILNDYLNNKE